MVCTIQSQLVSAARYAVVRNNRVVAVMLMLLSKYYFLAWEMMLFIVTSNNTRVWTHILLTLPFCLDEHTGRLAFIYMSSSE